MRTRCFTSRRNRHRRDPHRDDDISLHNQRDLASRSWQLDHGRARRRRTALSGAERHRLSSRRRHPPPHSTIVHDSPFLVSMGIVQRAWCCLDGCRYKGSVPMAVRAGAAHPDLLLHERAPPRAGGTHYPRGVRVQRRSQVLPVVQLNSRPGVVRRGRRGVCLRPHGRARPLAGHGQPPPQGPHRRRAARARAPRHVGLVPARA